MSDCRYCGKSAGFLRKAHKECDTTFMDASAHIAALFGRSIQAGHSEKALLGAIQDVSAKTNFVPSAVREVICKGWENSVESALEDGLVTKDEESYLVASQDHFGLTQIELDVHHAYTKLVEAVVLRDVAQGILRSRVNILGAIPFNLQAGETVVWYFNDVKYHKIRTIHQYVGSSQGLSIRISKGVYYRPSTYRGRKVETNRLELVDSGVLAITNKHMYFGGAVKNFRVPYGKIVSFEPLSDGIGIQRDAANAKPEYFECGDGWFVHNLVVNLAQLRL